MNGPALVLVELVAHSFAKLFEFAFLFRIVGLDECDLEEPETPGEVLEALALFEVGSYFGTDLPSLSKCVCIVNLAERAE